MAFECVRETEIVFVRSRCSGKRRCLRNVCSKYAEEGTALRVSSRDAQTCGKPDRVVIVKDPESQKFQRHGHALARSAFSAPADFRWSFHQSR
jgi:hypothetical protein